jgi:hypothetical protein
MLQVAYLHVGVEQRRDGVEVSCVPELHDLADEFDVLL